MWDRCWLTPLARQGRISRKMASPEAVESCLDEEEMVERSHQLHKERANEQQDRRSKKTRRERCLGGSFSEETEPDPCGIPEAFERRADPPPSAWAGCLGPGRWDEYGEHRLAGSAACPIRPCRSVCRDRRSCVHVAGRRGSPGAGSFPAPPSCAGPRPRPHLAASWLPCHDCDSVGNREPGAGCVRGAPRWLVGPECLGQRRAVYDALIRIRAPRYNIEQ